MIKMERETVKLFEGKFVKLVKRSHDPENPGRNTFNLYGELQEVTEDAVVLFTDRMGVILLEDIVSIEEAPRTPRRVYENR